MQLWSFIHCAIIWLAVKLGISQDLNDVILDKQSLWAMNRWCRTMSRDTEWLLGIKLFKSEEEVHYVDNLIIIQISAYEKPPRGESNLHKNSPEYIFAGGGNFGLNCEFMIINVCHITFYSAFLNLILKWMFFTLIFFFALSLSLSHMCIPCLTSSHL